MLSDPELCPLPGLVFVCGEGHAYSFLPANWTGICALGTLLPDVDIIPGNEPVPMPTLDYWGGRHKRGFQKIPLFVGLGIRAGVTTGMAGLGVATHGFTKLSRQLIDDIMAVSSTITIYRIK